MRNIIEKVVFINHASCERRAGSVDTDKFTSACSEKVNAIIIILAGAYVFGIWIYVSIA